MRKMLVLLALVALVPATGAAAPINFGDATFAAAHGQGSASFTVGDLGFTVSSYVPLISSTIYHSSGGFGVNHFLELPGVGDEVDSAEVLQIDFDGCADVASLTLANLFYERPLFGGAYYEQGSYRVNGGSWIGFQSNGSSSGFLTLDVNLLSVQSIEFTAPLSLRHDYSVAGMNAASVPEPASVLLLAMGLMGGAATLRRRR